MLQRQILKRIMRPLCKFQSLNCSFSLHHARLSSPANSGTSFPGQIVVVGGGAVGSLFAGRLGALKKMKGRIWMLSSWKEHTSSIEKLPGLIVQEEGLLGNGCLLGSVRCASSPKEILASLKDERGMGASTNISAVIIAVKHEGIRKASEQAAERLSKGRGGLCVALLNGMGHMEVISDALRCLSHHSSCSHNIATSTWC